VGIITTEGESFIPILEFTTCFDALLVILIRFFRLQVNYKSAVVAILMVFFSHHCCTRWTMH
jgi:hypothetical protein